MDDYSNLPIDKDIPAPQVFKPYLFPFSKMDIGDSVLIPIEGSSNAYVSINSAAKRFGETNNPPWKFTVRKRTGGVRVWRIE